MIRALVAHRSYNDTRNEGSMGIIRALVAHSSYNLEK